MATALADGSAEAVAEALHACYDVLADAPAELLAAHSIPASVAAAGKRLDAEVRCGCVRHLSCARPTFTSTRTQARTKAATGWSERVQDAHENVRPFLDYLRKK